MIRSLYGKLAGALFVIVLILAAVVVGIVVNTTRRYGQEVQQGLHRDLAANIVAEQLLMTEGGVHRAAMEEVFHDLMVINPAIEVYLLDTEGRILEHAAPPGKVVRDRVSLGPIRTVVEGEPELPVLGDDPRHEGRRKIFSVAPVEVDGETAGYLYIVLAGEAYASTLGRVAGSQILRAGVVMVAVASVLALVGGLGLFWVLTRRLRRLREEVRRFASGDETRLPEPPAHGNAGDEIASLRSAFREMAERIVLQLEELRRLDASRRELVANVSHDLRTPLAHIQGYVETIMLREEVLLPMERREYLQIALRQCERLGELVEDLFDLARLDARAIELEPERFSPTELVQDLTREFRLRAEEQEVELVARLGTEDPRIEADLRLVERVFRNLIENALHYTSPGGRVEIALEARQEGVRVKVSDSGDGIPEEEMEQIFERYYRVRGSGDRVGGGLGLAIAKRIVELHGGTIDCESELGRGTTFAVFLPGR